MNDSGKMPDTTINSIGMELLLIPVPGRVPGRHGGRWCRTFFGNAHSERTSLMLCVFLSY